MKNRAKCKLCNDIIESLHPQDYQLCKCGAIFVDGGDQMFCGAKNWDNFLRVDDEGKEFGPKIMDETPIDLPTLSKEDKIGILGQMLEAYKNLPPQAQLMNPTNYDLYAALSIVHEIFKS